MVTNRPSLLGWGLGAGLFELGQGIEQFDAVAARILWKLDETDLGDIGLVDDPNALFIAVAMAGNVKAAEILGAADRASPLRHPAETRAYPLVKGKYTAGAAPPFAIIALQGTAETPMNDPPETMRFGETLSPPIAIEKERIDEPLNGLAVKALSIQLLPLLKSPLRLGFQLASVLDQERRGDCRLERCDPRLKPDVTVNHQHGSPGLGLMAERGFRLLHCVATQ